MSAMDDFARELERIAAELHPEHEWRFTVRQDDGASTERHQSVTALHDPHTVRKGPLTTRPATGPARTLHQDHGGPA